jgi:DNA/RNA endonuclease YhcR with UshA esterase domain
MRLSALLAVLAITAAAAHPAQAQDPRITPLSQARAQGVGANVVVEGVVTVPPGVFDGGFAIQDRTAGIWVMPPADAVLLRLGQRVLVRGTLDEANGQLAIHPAAIGPLGDRDAPAPRAVRTGALGETDEGSLVQVRGRVAGEVVDDAPWGWKVMVDDGSGPVLVFVDAESNVDVAPFRVGDTVEVTGFAGQYDDHYEVIPRAQMDIRVLPQGPGSSSLTRN